MTTILAFTRLDHGAIELMLLDEDGELRTETLDDIKSVKRWGQGFILSFHTRDPVMVRADRTVHMLSATA